MIKDRAAWERWEANYIRQTPIDVARNFRIVEALYQEARALGILPRADPLEGFEAKLAFIKAIHASATSRQARE